MVYDQTRRQSSFKFKRVECPEPVEGQWFVYLLECIDNSLYCGSTDNLARRILEHNKGTAALWTKMRRPLQLVYYEEWDTLTGARRRELQIKGWVQTKKVNLIIGKWIKS